MISSFKKLVHFYTHDMKLQAKFLLSHFILVLAPTLVVSLLIYNQLAAVMLSNTIHSEQVLSGQTVSSIENSVAQVNAASVAIVNNDFFAKLLQANDGIVNTALLSDPAFLTDTLSFLNTVNATIDGLNISDVKIYLDQPLDKLYSNPTITDYNIFHPVSEIKGSYWHGIFSSTNSRMIVCPSLYLTLGEAQKYGEFAIARKITYSSQSQTAAAYVLVYFSKANIDSILSKNISIPDSATYLVNQRNTIVSSSNANIAGKYFLGYDEIAKNIPDQSQFQTRTFAADKAYISYKKISGTDWLMVSVMPVNSVQKQNQVTIWQFALAYVLFLGIAFFASLQLSNSIVKRISSVINQMKLVRVGKPKPLSRQRERDEIGDLIVTYNYMSDEINKLMLKEEMAAEDLRIAEFKALQSQINPHFLYNTLDMINWLSQTGQTAKVADAVQALSKFYKLTLGTGNIAVSIREELSQVSLYVELQNMRYRNMIRFVIDVPEDLLDFEIPKFVLQPIVENSIQHGIFEKESKEGTIVITGWMEEEYVTLIISDDGVGIDPDKVALILSGQGDSGNSNIGIYNTHKRLMLYYKQSFGLTYRSEKDSGTEVEIHFPANPHSTDN